MSAKNDSGGGAADVNHFSVDPDDLTGIVGDLGRTEKALTVLIQDLNSQLVKLNSTWEGLSKTAMVEAKEEWEKGFTIMHQGLGSMRQAADLASGHYRGAVASNQSMWDQL